MSQVEMQELLRGEESWGRSRELEKEMFEKCWQLVCSVIPSVFPSKQCFWRCVCTCEREILNLLKLASCGGYR